MSAWVYREMDGPAPFDPIEPGLAPGGIVTRLYTDDRTEMLSSTAITPDPSDPEATERAADVDGFVASERLARGLGTWSVAYDGDTGRVIEAFHVHPNPPHNCHT